DWPHHRTRCPEDLEGRRDAVVQFRRSTTGPCDRAIELLAFRVSVANRCILLQPSQAGSFIISSWSWPDWSQGRSESVGRLPTLLAEANIRLDLAAASVSVTELCHTRPWRCQDPKHVARLRSSFANLWTNWMGEIEGFCRFV